MVATTAGLQGIGNIVVGRGKMQQELWPQQESSTEKQSGNWRDHAPQELRNHLVYKVIQSVVTADESTWQDPRMQHVIAFAKGVESNIFKTAKTRSEYYHKLAEKIYKIQQQLDDKRQKRKQNTQLQPFNESADPNVQNTITDTFSAESSSEAVPVTDTDVVIDELEEQIAISQEIAGLSSTTFPSPTELFLLPLMSRDPLNAPADLPSVSMTGSPITRPEQCKIIQQQLTFLNHAGNCWQTDSTKKCPQPYCMQMKVILHHIANCQEDATCSVYNCAFYKDIYTHWNVCKSSDCPLCLPVALEEILSIHD